MTILIGCGLTAQQWASSRPGRRIFPGGIWVPVLGTGIEGMQGYLAAGGWIERAEGKWINVN